MLNVQQLTKRFPTGPVLDEVSFALNDGEKVGLVGPNGSGKSTLLRLIAGRLEADSGRVRLGPRDRVGYLEQYPARDLDRTVGELLIGANSGWDEARVAVLNAAELLALPGQPPAGHDAALRAYAAAVARFEELGGYEVASRSALVRAGLELQHLAPGRAVRTLSGGEKTRLALGQLLLNEPTILLLDEPTNYLDLPALLWLERFVDGSRASAIIVSHDRRFLDRTVTGILELDAATRRVRRYEGNFTLYTEQKRGELEKYEARYQDQVERVRAVRRQIDALKGQAIATETNTIHFHYRKVAQGVARRAKVQERRLERFLASEEKLERPATEKGLFLTDLAGSAIDDRRLAVAARDLAVSYAGIPLFENVSLTVHGRDRLALIGPNGGGKSTLLRLLAGRTTPGAVTRGEIRLGGGVRIGYLPQEHPAAGAGGERTVLATFRAGVTLPEHVARAFLDKFLFAGDQVHRTINELSYGERAKLALATLIADRASFLLLDEPTSHLDLHSLDRIEQALAAYPGPAIIASHDRHFLAAVGVTGVLLLAAGALRQLPDLETYEREALRDRNATRLGVATRKPNA